MPPIVALLICSAFVAFLLKLDYQRTKDLTLTSWLPTLWMLYSASKPLPYWFGGRYVEDVSAQIIAGSPMDRNFLSALIVIGLMILVWRKIDWRQVVMDNRWLLLLFLYMLVSIIWSDYPYVSFKRWFKASGCIIMALVVLTGPFPFKSIEAILRRTIYILIPFSALLVKYFPHKGVKWGRWSGIPMWVGATMGKNTLGILCMVSILFLIWTWLKGRKGVELPFTKYDTIAYFMIFLMTLWLQRGPGSGMFSSATSMIVLILGLATLFILRRLKTGTHLGAMACLFLLVTGGVYLLMQGVLSIHPLEVVAPMVGRDTSLTGRTDVIWSYVMPICKNHFLLGKGYGGFWIVPLQLDKFTVNQAHNGFLDIFVELGVVGMILFVIVIVAYFRKAADLFKQNIEWGSLMLTFLLMSMVHNYTESSYLKSTTFLWNIYIMLMFLPTRYIESMPGKIST